MLEVGSTFPKSALGAAHGLHRKRLRACNGSGTGSRHWELLWAGHRHRCCAGAEACSTGTAAALSSLATLRQCCGTGPGCGNGTGIGTGNCTGGHWAGIRPALLRHCAALGRHVSVPSGRRQTWEWSLPVIDRKPNCGPHGARRTKQRAKRIRQPRGNPPQQTCARASVP